MWLNFRRPRFLGQRSLPAFRAVSYVALVIMDLPAFTHFPGRREGEANKASQQHLVYSKTRQRKLCARARMRGYRCPLHCHL